METWEWPAALCVLSFGHFVRRDHEGVVTVDTREIGSLPEHGTAVWTDVLRPHSLENVSDVEIRVISVELKHR